MPEQRTDNPTDLFKQLRGKSPEEAKFFWSGGPVEVAERTWFQSVARMDARDGGRKSG
jgi:hypothetical protein